MSWRTSPVRHRQKKAVVAPVGQQRLRYGARPLLVGAECNTRQVKAAAYSVFQWGLFLLFWYHYIGFSTKKEQHFFSWLGIGRKGWSGPHWHLKNSAVVFCKFQELIETSFGILSKLVANMAVSLCPNRMWLYLVQVAWIVSLFAGTTSENKPGRAFSLHDHSKAPTRCNEALRKTEYVTATVDVLLHFRATQTHRAVLP